MCVLILTAKDQLHDHIAGLNVGADDYLIKPFAYEELLARVRSLVRHNRSIQPSHASHPPAELLGSRQKADPWCPCLGTDLETDSARR
jgi:DNA-binding response OmpR family regulator